MDFYEDVIKECEVFYYFPYIEFVFTNFKIKYEKTAHRDYYLDLTSKSCQAYLYKYEKNALDKI